jgi:hypothetical protein
MRRRKLRWVLTGLIVLAGLFLISRWWTRPDWKNIDRIQSGMTRAEVEALIGCSPGDYGTHEPHPLFPPGSEIWPPDTVTYFETNGHGVTWLRWTDDSQGFMVEIVDTSGRVTFACDAAVRWGQKAGPLDAFLWRVKRQWRRWFPEKP